MIFASDLDHTLIYSERFLPQANNSDLIKVESAISNSFMTKKAAKILLNLSIALTFIPCTTRTIEQYKRISFLESEIKSAWAIVSNGANILINGKVDQGYQKAVRQKLKHECSNFEEILNQFSKLNPSEWTEPLRQADDVFFYCIFNKEKIPQKEFEGFSSWAKGENWNISLQGRKLYLVPNVVDKAAALERVAQMLGKQILFSAGDSLLDVSLLKIAKNSFVPIHGEIRHYFPDSCKWEYTKASGLLAGEEILENIFDILELGVKPKP